MEWYCQHYHSGFDANAWGSSQLNIASCIAFCTREVTANDRLILVAGAVALLQSNVLSSLFWAPCIDR